MSDLYAHILIKDAGVEPLGAKEAVAMALEHLGGVRVLSVEFREPKQLSMMGDTKKPTRPKPSPSVPSGQVSARSSRRPQTAMVCCDSCGYFRWAPDWDPEQKPYWGTCGRTGELVYDLKHWCGAWARLGG